MTLFSQRKHNLPVNKALNLHQKMGNIVHHLLATFTVQDMFKNMKYLDKNVKIRNHSPFQIKEKKILLLIFKQTKPKRKSSFSNDIYLLSCKNDIFKRY